MVTLLVGPQGSGKSTWANDAASNGGYGDTTIISQDLQGQKGHWEAFMNAVDDRSEGYMENHRIIVDRINHTKEQRAKYINYAKARGWKTEILVMNQPFTTCLERIDKRVGHPSIKDHETAIAALRMYFMKYEHPAMDEADSVVYFNAYDPFLMDLNNVYPLGTRFIVIGDVHGCYDELMELLEKMNYKKGEDVIVFCGDLIDRGPKIDQVLQFAMTTPRVHSVKGNHEDKLARHMANMGAGLVSKIKIGHGLQNTIDQCVASNMLDDNLMAWLWSMPLVIKFGKNYVFHAGVNPRYPMLRQNREFLLYARKFNPELNTFDDDNSPAWYQHDLHESLRGSNLFFGHDVHEITDPLHFATFQKNKSVFPMDGGCYFGGNLNGCVVNSDWPISPVTLSLQFFSVPSRQPKEEHEPMYLTWNEPYDERVKAGFLGKSETKDLVLYNYTDKCTYEKKWDKYTLECRGLIFEKATGRVIARPFGKFFNLGENENTQLNSLPSENYSCYEKMDGSLGILYHYSENWNAATRGSFASEQAKQAAEMLKQYNMTSVNPEVTLLTEIIYPENRHNAGARLVVDYGATRMLVLLAAYDRRTGEELTRGALEMVSVFTGMPIVQRFDFTIEEMIAMQKTLPADKEGFVARFDSGLRIKIKGQEYCRMQKILNSITPLVIWDLMLERGEGFAVPSAYMMSVPEEYRHEVLDIVFKLKEKKSAVLREVEEDFDKVVEATGVDVLQPITQEMKKKVGLFLTQGPGRATLRHPSMMFAIINGKSDAVEMYCRKAVRPTSNQL